jgi:hypothetical protein
VIGLILEFLFQGFYSVSRFQHVIVSRPSQSSLLYRLIIFKYPDYIDAYLRLAAIAKGKNNIQLGDALKINNKYPNALSMLGTLELQNDENWLTAKERFPDAKDATGGKDPYFFLELGTETTLLPIALRKRPQNLRLLIER